MGRPVFFSMAIILLAFIPVFALTGQEGKLFHPLAFTKTFAVLAATVVAVTLVPVLCSLLLGGKFHKEEDNPVMRGLRRMYRPALEAALGARVITVAIAALLVRGRAVRCARDRQRVHAAAQRGRPDVHAHRGSEHFAGGEHEECGEAERDPAIVSRGRLRRREGGAGGHLDGPRAAEHDGDGGPPQAAGASGGPGMTVDRLRAEMSRAAQLPGVSPIWTMPIINRIDMLTTGIRSEVGVKIFGTDLMQLEALARQVADAVRTVPGASNIYPEQVTSGQYLNIEVDRAAARGTGLVSVRCSR